MHHTTTINAGCQMMVNNVDEENLLLNYLKPDMRVLEFGFGLSTVAMARKVRQVVSIENDRSFYEQFIRSQTLAYNIHVEIAAANQIPSEENADGTYQEFKNYIEAPRPLANNEKFDVVFIDGRARVACAQFAAKYYVKPGGVIFIHDYRHPDPKFRRPEYEVVESFLDLKAQAFAMAMFTVRHTNFDAGEGQIPSGPIPHAFPSQLPEMHGAPQQAAAAAPPPVVPANFPKPALADAIATDKNTCWYDPRVPGEMNRFYDLHIRTHDILPHMQPFTDLLELIYEPGYPGKLLDLGCGTGMLSDFCRDYDYVGSDLPHIIAGSALRNYPDKFYRACDFLEQDLGWISMFDVVVLNGVIDVMQDPLNALRRVLSNAFCHVIIHRQEITKQGSTRSEEGPGYGGFAWHSIIAEADFKALINECGFEIKGTTRCSFGNWEDGGTSFLLKRVNIFEFLQNNMERLKLASLVQHCETIMAATDLQDGLNSSGKVSVFSALSPVLSAISEGLEQVDDLQDLQQEIEDNVPQNEQVQLPATDKLPGEEIKDTQPGIEKPAVDIPQSPGPIVGSNTAADAENKNIEKGRGGNSKNRSNTNNHKNKNRKK